MSENNKANLQIRDNGPIRVTGDVELMDSQGNVFTTKKAFSLCRCGASSNKPFCDGTHKKIEFDSEPRAD
ncbi:CDGSH iron-sulfur domain-containing protein [Aquibacillus sp. 3ASR75-11]|uniref:CDGSH iron-sulfur domain-containing protein n=1 Tax=Terrihalobacillus insolitus TaxID=2950438 RepID=A0A9X3WP25_9BACI|nr:CDGSH iron-sulfur domain-containing protein [Terrihalobacillus insolitus]MDC3412092.1 CDGSH iron-sulfur domain-containing protein [Terrihalobacillus insolitus]MDC3423215.1 CDGSH iron-sulfur domain-containing protein [Terrihalobacillus insolitus]